jgi:hypothetical protein
MSQVAPYRTFAQRANSRPGLQPPDVAFKAFWRLNRFLICTANSG